jgi:hypothetical protein
VELVAAIWTGFIGSLVSGFALCLLLVLAIDAVRQGHRLYLGAVVGLSAALLGRMAEGFMLPAADTLLKVGGLLLAALVIAIDLMTEVVVEPEEEPAS